MVEKIEKFSVPGADSEEKKADVFGLDRTRLYKKSFAAETNDFGAN